MTGADSGILALTIFDKSASGRRASSFPVLGADEPQGGLPAGFLRKSAPALPEVSELDLVRHYTNLSRRNWAIDVGPYPLGSCTMKYNPKLHEEAAALPGFRRLHPWQPESQIQGALALLWKLEKLLTEVTGMSRASFQPPAGASGELTGLLIVRAYHASRGDPRRVVIIPDSAHGTNPATVTRAGYEVRQVRSDGHGMVDLEQLDAALDDQVAGFMLTNPNTLGRFESQIERVAGLVHGAGGLLYYDGANLNAIMGIARPGDMGFDVVHMNLHKTFSTPHGGGGPGAGPVAVTSALERFLPAPTVGYDAEAGRYFWETDRPHSIGRVHGFHGNFAVVLRAYAYILSIGGEGLKKVSERAVLNANYLLSRIQPDYPAPYSGAYLHEFVVTTAGFKSKGVRALDIAKRLIDLGFHPPTMYFPQIVEEALMFEPTETESKQTLDALTAALKQIGAEASESPELLHEAPTKAPVRRLEETQAARHPVLRL